VADFYSCETDEPFKKGIKVFFVYLVVTLPFSPRVPPVEDGRNL
jgi:hypothetical protein